MHACRHACMGARTLEDMSATIGRRQVRIDDDVYDAFRLQSYHRREPITALANDMLRTGLQLAEAGVLNLPTEEIIRIVKESQK